jgi:hypothetical protein
MPNFDPRMNKLKRSWLEVLKAINEAIPTNDRQKHHIKVFLIPSYWRTMPDKIYAKTSEIAETRPFINMFPSIYFS